MRNLVRHHFDPVPTREEEINDYYNEDWGLGGAFMAVRRGRDGRKIQSKR